MKLQIGSYTHQGMVRSVNQDSLGVSKGVSQELLDDRGQLLVVADGFGKGGAGSAASSAAVQAVTHAYYTNQGPDQGAALVQALKEANTVALKHTANAGSSMSAGTTMTVAVIRGEELIVAHVGDSRAYLLRDGQLRQLTQDHDWATEQVRQGSLTPEQAQQHPKRRNITRAVGIQSEVDADQSVERFLPGDTLLLCSDGLTDQVQDSELAHELVGSDAQAVTQRLVDLANQRGGSDNIAVIVAKVISIKTATWIPIAIIGGTIAAMLLLVAIFASGNQTFMFQKTATPTMPPITATAILTSTPTPGITPTASATTIPPSPTTPPLPKSIYSAPDLIGPDDGMVFRGKEADVRLMWGAVGDLAADDYYVVISDFLHEGQLWHDWQWTKQTELKMPRYMFDNAKDDHRIEWRVVVWRLTGTQSDGSREGVAVGNESPKRSFIWQPENPNSATATPDFDG